MFKKTNRLSRSSFDHYFKTGKRLQTPELTLIYSPHPTTHAAVVVGKKVAKKAHERNKIRRRTYGVLYRHLKQAGVTGVYIILTKPSFTQLSTQMQILKVQNILKRITIAP